MSDAGSKLRVLHGIRISADHPSSRRWTRASHTPSQALLLLNESEYLGAARELARIVLGTKEMTGAQRLAFAYETVTSKLPDEKERQILSDLLLTLQKSYLEQPALADEICSGLNLGTAKKRAQLAAWTVLVNALYNLDITKTRE